MKILILSQNAGSPRHGMVFRNYVWAREWVKQGHEVTIITSSFAHSRNENPKTTTRVAQEEIDGINYIWVWGNRFKQSNIIGRLLSMALFTLQCLLLPLPVRNDFDLVIASSPNPLAIYAARLFARRNKAKLIYDIRDLWPLALLQHGNVSYWNPVVALMAHAEKYACRHADLVTAVPQNCEAYLSTRGLESGKFLAVANGILDEPLPFEEMPPAHRQLFDRLKQDGRFTVGYTGAMGTANALHALVNAIKLADDNIHAVFMGQGSNLDKLKSLAQQLDIGERVHFLEPVPRAQVSSFLNRIDAAYLGLENKPLYKLGTSPTKLNDYMLAAKPIVYACGDSASGVELSHCGIICEAENARHIADALNELSRMTKEQLQQMGERGREWLLKNRLVSEQTKQILAALNP